jgi:hypothetical protein
MYTNTNYNKIDQHLEYISNKLNITDIETLAIAAFLFFVLVVLHSLRQKHHSSYV